MSRERDEREWYRFGQPEARGLLGAIRVPQLVALLVGVALTLVLMRLVPAAAAPLALSPAVVALVAAFAPVRGMVAADWALLALVHATARASGQASYRAPRSTRHPEALGEGGLGLPGCWGRWRIVPVDAGAGSSVGVLLDDRKGTASATLLAHSRADELLSEAEQERRVASWGQVLASLARESRPVRRIAWVERTVPAEVDEIAGYLSDNRGSTGAASGAVAAYMELIDGATRVALEHESFLTIEIEPRRRPLGGRANREANLAQAAVEELRLLAHAIEDAGLATVGALPPRLLAAAIRHGLDPTARGQLTRLAAAGAQEGCAPSVAGPVAIEEDWDRVRVDSVFARTYRVARWPSRDVGALFLAPLLARTQARRSVSVVCEPVAPTRAWRQAEAAVTGEEGDARTRARHGFISTARQSRRRTDIEQRERELTDGHQQYRFSGHVTVHADTREELERACAEVVQAAMHAHLELQPLYGQQQQGLQFGLPGFCRGLD